MATQLLQHVQMTPSNTWTVVHNFGVFPAVDIWLTLNNGSKEKAFPLSIEHVSENQLLVKWTFNATGTASLAG